MKRFYVFLSCLLVVLLVWAVPAEKKRMFVPLIQGGTVEVTFSEMKMGIIILRMTVF